MSIMSGGVIPAENPLSPVESQQHDATEIWLFCLLLAIEDWHNTVGGTMGFWFFQFLFWEFNRLFLVVIEKVYSFPQSLTSEGYIPLSCA